jgi:hypothetical protein
VSVPVLSEQMQEVDPKVSTPSKFLTNTLQTASLLAVSARLTVIAAITPSGTLAAIKPIAKIKFVIAAIKF